MSNSLKQDVINAVGKDRYIQSCKEIAQMYDDAERGICSNIQISTEKELSLYNVQISTIADFRNSLINKFVYALNEDDAKRLVLKRYENLKVEIIEIYCQKVDIKRGMMFNV